jgi:hypothetical protein
MAIPFQAGLEIVQGFEAGLFEFPYPTHVHLVDRNRIEVMQFFTPLPFDGDEIRIFEQR